MNAQTTTATQAVEILEAEGFDAGDIEAVLSSFIDASTDLPWDDDEDEWLLSAADMQVLRGAIYKVTTFRSRRAQRHLVMTATRERRADITTAQVQVANRG
jgi:hypothetical protein